MFVGSLSPPRGSNPPLRYRRDVLYPLYYEEMLSFFALLHCSAVLFCSLAVCLPLSLSLSLSVSRPLSPSSPLFCSLSSPSLGVSLVPLPLLTPLLDVPYQAYRRSHGSVLSSV